MKQALPLLKALVEPVRIRLYLLLKKSSLTVSELSEILSLSQSNTSHHVKALRDLGLLSAEKTGQHTYYGLNSVELSEERLATLLKNLEAFSEEIPEAKNDAVKLRTVLADRSEDKFALWRMEQPDLPYSDIFAHLACGKKGTIVDIGCGEGDFFEALSLSFEKIIALDIDAMHTQKAAQRAADFNNIHVMIANAEILPLADGCVDAVVLRMALSQMPNPLVAAAEALRILKQGGFVSIIDHESGGDKLSKYSENFRQKILAFFQNQKSVEQDFERSLPRLFMLRLRKT